MNVIEYNIYTMLRKKKINTHNIEKRDDERKGGRVDSEHAAD